MMGMSRSDKFAVINEKRAALFLFRGEIQKNDTIAAGGFTAHYQQARCARLLGRMPHVVLQAFN
jgi:hypothetical protein